MKAIKAILPIVGLVILVAIVSLWVPDIVIGLPKFPMPKIFGL